jgi:hypothetical protein
MCGRQRIGGFGMVYEHTIQYNTIHEWGGGEGGFSASGLLLLLVHQCLSFLPLALDELLVLLDEALGILVIGQFSCLQSCVDDCAVNEEVLNMLGNE